MRDRLPFVSPHFWLDLFAHKRIPTSLEPRSHGKRWSLLDYPSQVNIRAPRRRRSAERLHGSFITVKTHASSRLSGHRARMNLFAESRHCFAFRCFFASGAARARFFCTHQRSRMTESTVFKHIHHKDRRQQQLFQWLALHDCTASYVRSRSKHIFSASLGTPADGARQVRLACAKPQTSREVDQDPEGGLTRQCNARPSFLIMYCVPKEQRQHDNHCHKTTTAGTLHNVYKVDGDEPELLEHEVPEPEDAHEEGKP